MGGLLTLLGVGNFVSETTGAADPQLQFFENFPGKDGAGLFGFSSNTLSVHAVNIPLSLSFNYPVLLIAHGVATSRSQTATLHFGLYSLNGSTLSLENSASQSTTRASGSIIEWISLVTSATQNISPGAWYFALNVSISSSGGGEGFSIFANSSINPGNVSPVFVRGRMTASTAAMPASIATSALDITGSDAMRQPYIIITA